MKFFIFRAVLIVFLFTSLIQAQNAALDEVHLFQGFFRDTPVSAVPYGEGGLTFSDLDFGSAFELGVQGGYPLSPEFEFGAALGIVNVNPSNGDSESGLSDLLVTGRYRIVPDRTNISAGGYLTLPIGREDVGQGNADFGVFGALRHPLNSGLVLTSTVGLDFLEGGADRETSLYLGGGVIYPTNRQLSIIGEFTLMSEGEFVLLNGGLDYVLQSGGRLRGALGFGLDDGAPDVMLRLAYLQAF